MPEIKVVNLDKRIRVGYGANLRRALLRHGIQPYRGIARYLNCHGFGHCCTCVVKVLRGDVNEKSIAEQYHPLRPKGEDERLSCQVRVYSDVEIDTLQSPDVEELLPAETKDEAGAKEEEAAAV